MFSRFQESCSRICHEFMSEVDPYTVVKWILIVLAAGFIGQFGKAFAQYLMRRTREKASERNVPAGKPVDASSGQKAAHPVMTGEGKDGRTTMPETSDADSAISDEKARKKAAKAKKKEIKLFKKLFK